MGKPVIAVINDDPDYLEMMEVMLEAELACEVVIGQKECDALDVIRANSPNLVILDVIMGREPAGVDILEAVRSDPDVGQVPVIICSADSAFLHQNAEKLQELDSAWLEKPFDLEDILALIDQKLDVARSGTRNPSPGAQ